MNRLALCLLLLIIVLAAFLRLWQLDSIPPGLYPDVAINGKDALNALQTGQFKVFYPENNGREGLFINLIALSFAIFGPSVWAIKIAAAIIGVLTVWGVYLFAQELFSGKSLDLSGVREQTSDSSNSNKTLHQLQHYNILALLAAFLLATSFWHINFSRIGFRAILLPLILTFAFYFLLKGLRFLSLQHLQRRALLYFILAGIIYGLGFYTYISFRLSVLILPFIFIPYWLAYRKQKTITASAILQHFTVCSLWFATAAIIVALPLAIYFVQHTQDFISRASGISVFAQPSPIKSFAESLVIHLGMFHIFGDPNWRHNFSGAPMLPLFAGILFLSGIILSFKKMIQTIREDKDEAGGHLPFTILLAWFFIMLLPGVLTAEGLPHALRVIGVIPPVYILSAVGAAWLYEKLNVNTKSRKLLFLSALAVLASIAVVEYDVYFNRWAKNPEVKGAFTQNFVKMGQYLNSLPADAQKYVIVNEPGVPVPYPEGIPMPAQTLMFIERAHLAYGGTDLPLRSNLATYLKPDQIETIATAQKVVVLIMKEEPSVIMKILGQMLNSRLEKEDSFWVIKSEI